MADVEHVRSARSGRDSTPARSEERAGKGLKAPPSVVFLIDVDNTLFDNDRFKEELSNRLEQEFGVEGRDRYWGIYEALRSELGYADFLGALQRFRVQDDGDPRLPPLASFLLDYPFYERLYPGVMDVIAHLRRIGVPVVVSDGDVVFQPRKIERAGVWRAVDGRVLIYIHKEKVLDHVEKRYPARHYVMIDDKPHILAAMKKLRGERLTTVLPRQGHYALDPQGMAQRPAPDLTIDAIADLVRFDLPTLREAAQAVRVDKEA